MQLNDVQFGLARPGEYRFYVTGVISTDKEGNNLVTKKGNPYKKLCLTVLNASGECYDVYDFIFNSDRIKQIFTSVKSGVSPTAKFDMEHLNLLIGQQGECLVGIKKGDVGYNDQNKVKCYIPKREMTYEQPPKSNGCAEDLKTEDRVVENFGIEESDDIPF